MNADEAAARIAEQDQEIAALRAAINSFRWVGNNLHNRCTYAFRDYFDAALEDAKTAMHDEWERIDVERRR